MSKALYSSSVDDSLALIAELHKKPLELGWLASLVEGEGTIVWTEERKFRIEVKMTDLDTLQKISAIAGGSIYRERKNKPHHKDPWRWVVSGRVALRLAEVLFPLMHARRADCMKEVVAKYEKHQSSSLERKNRFVEHGVASAEEYLAGHGSMQKLGDKYGISWGTVRKYVQLLKAGKIPSVAERSVPAFHPSDARVFPLVRENPSLKDALQNKRECLVKQLAEKPLFLGRVVGLFDGEGSVSEVGGNRLRFQSEMTDLDVLTSIQRLVGGNICQVSKRKEHHKQSWQWYIEGPQALVLAEVLLPHLSERRVQRVSELTTAYKEYYLPRQAQKELIKEQTQKAALEYLEGGTSLNKMAEKYNISSSTVERGVKRLRAELLAQQ